MDSALWMVLRFCHHSLRSANKSKLPERVWGCDRVFVMREITAIGSYAGMISGPRWDGVLISSSASQTLGFNNSSER